MKKNSTPKQDDYELKDQYDLSKMTILPKGRFSPEHRAGKNIVVLEPDVAQVFPDDEAVNKALRSLIKLTPTKDRQIGEKKTKYRKQN
jgi:hypothetical protein